MKKKPAAKEKWGPFAIAGQSALLTVLLLAALLGGCHKTEKAAAGNGGEPGTVEEPQPEGVEDSKAEPAENLKLSPPVKVAPPAEPAKGEISMTPLEVAGQTGSDRTPGQFTELTGEDTGLVFTNELKPANMRKYLLNGAGIATGDYDNDGRVDVYAVSQDGSNRLFRQVAPWKFEDVTESAGDLSGGDYQGTGASFADINNDGWLDLYVCNINGPNLLFINQGNGTFSSEASDWGIDFGGASTMASFADYDRDGDLDLYLVNNRILSIGEESPKVMLRKIGDRAVVHPDFQEQYFLIEGKIQEAGQRDRLFRNDGNKNYVDVTDESGIQGFDMGLSATWWDFDNDGWMDVYVANDLKSPDHLYRNLGNGRFEDVTGDSIGHTPWFSMGADAADINNDGRMDLLVADMSSTTHYKQKTTMGEMGNSAWFLNIGRPRQFMRNTLFLNSGTSRFFEVANLAGLDSTDWSWSIKFGDFDGDMMSDVFVTNGVGRNMNDSDSSQEYSRLLELGRKAEAEAMLQKMPPLEERNLAFRNRGDLHFENVSKQWGIDHLGVSQGASVADIDRDGDLDILVNNMNEPLGIYRNDIDGGNNLLVQLKGTSSNRFGVNARVSVTVDGTVQIRQINLARGFMSADEPIAHFGLGNHKQIDELAVVWPGGNYQRFTDIDANQLVTITEGELGSTAWSSPSTPDAWFTDRTGQSELDYRHRELALDDFQIQPLLPNKLTQLGPGMAWGDVNGDGRDDCYMGGASGGRGQLFIQTASETFQKSGRWRDRSFEDMGALFFDIDSDDDLDLYIVSGGYERDREREYLEDRLYLNDGSGNFEAAPAGTIPDLQSSGSCVTAADFDRDGDLDLFVGTRLLPARWPLPATSWLLENREGRLVNATSEKAGPLADIGLVTGAVWSDIDQDGWVDLMVTLEWGAVRVLGNDRGKLVDRTEQSGLSNFRGWWNSIVGGDIDNDGDMDFVAMNVGLNTKYHATDEHPAILFAQDLDSNGTLDLIEAEYEDGVCYPIRGKSCSSHAIPFLNEKFDSFHDFALADLAEIYTDESLNKSTKFTANHLESVVLLNDGNGTFQVRNLPRMAQVSPGFGTALEDFDGDGFLDICIAQNFLHPQPETGQMDGGMGMILRGRGNGDFEFVSVTESGIVVEGQGMALSVTDINHDSAPDLVMTVNDSASRVWINQLPQTSSGRKRLTVFLKSLTGNRSAVGSRLVTKTGTGQVQAHDVVAGSGYLSQSTTAIFVSSDPDDPIETIEVTWPDGSSQAYPVEPDKVRITIDQTATESD